MNSKKILLSVCTTIAVAISFAFGVSINSKSYANVSDVTVANIDAFMTTRELDCNYFNESEECTINVGAKGEIKLFNGTILKAGADGYITFDGKVICISKGNQTCEPVSCKEIYQVVLNSENGI